MNFRHILLILFCVLLVTQANSATGRFRVMFGSDPSTTMMIGWDKQGGTDHTLHYDTIDHGTQKDAYANSLAPQTTFDYYGMQSQFALIENLQPATAYYFVISDNEGESARMWFLTASDTPDSQYTIIAGGDSRTNRTPRQKGNRLVAKLRPLFVLFTGDYITDANSQSQWQTWLDDWQLTIAEDGRIFPIVAAQGNHEHTESVEKLFNTPADAIFAQSFGGDHLRIYTLNTEINSFSDQAIWMRQDISNNDAFWRIAHYHKPVRPHRGSKSEGSGQYEHWVPIFDEFKFALVHEADAHTVKTTWPIVASDGAGSDEGFIRDDSGTVYIGEGCWGAPLRECDDPKEWTRQCPGNSPFDQFSWIRVNGSIIETRTIKFANEDQVAALSNDWGFEEPSNLDVWDEGGHRVITIDRSSSTHAVPLPFVSKLNPGKESKEGPFDLKGARIFTKSRSNRLVIIIREGKPVLQYMSGRRGL